MGFKCPICLKDFGNDKKEWEKHIQTKHDGIGLDIVYFVKKTVKGEKKKGGKRI